MAEARGQQGAAFPRVASPSHTPIAPAAVPSPRHANQAWVDPKSETHFRIDPPQGVRTSQPDIVAPLATEQTPWQQQLVAIDQFLRDYGRVILLLAVMAAAGFALLVLNSGGAPPTGPVDSPIPSPANRIAPATPEEMKPSPQLRPIDPPRVAEALGPEGLAIRQDLDKPSPSDSEITPIKPHFEGHVAEPTESKSNADGGGLPYPSTDLPSWEGAEHRPTDEDPSNVAVLRSVRPTR